MHWQQEFGENPPKHTVRNHGDNVTNGHKRDNMNAHAFGTEFRQREKA